MENILREIIALAMELLCMGMTQEAASGLISFFKKVDIRPNGLSFEPMLTFGGEFSRVE